MTTSLNGHPQLPPRLSETRKALHRLAAYVIAPTCYRSTGRFGLRSTPNGFGTPLFDGDRRIRVDGSTLIDERTTSRHSHRITSLRAAADFLGSAIDAERAAEHDTPALGMVDADLHLDQAASEFLGAWFATAFAALARLRADDRSVAPSEPQLWPGHFDAAIEEGDDDHRGSYGASPGDDAIDEPYVYLSSWRPDKAGLDRSDSFWNATGFAGRVLRYSDFAPAAGPIEVMYTFWREARDHLR